MCVSVWGGDQVRQENALSEKAGGRRCRRLPKIVNTRLHQHLCLQAHKDQLEYDVAKSSLGKWLRAVNSHMLLRRLVLSTGLSRAPVRIPILPSIPTLTT